MGHGWPPLCYLLKILSESLGMTSWSSYLIMRWIFCEFFRITVVAMVSCLCPCHSTPPNPCAGILTHGAFKRWLGHEGEALRGGSSDVIKKAPQWLRVPSLFFHVRIWWNKFDTRKTAFTWPCWHSNLSLPASRSASSQFLLFISYEVCGVVV